MNNITLLIEKYSKEVKGIRTFLSGITTWSKNAEELKIKSKCIDEFILSLNKLTMPIDGIIVNKKNDVVPIYINLITSKSSDEKIIESPSLEMKMYAKIKCDEQRKLLHDTLTNLVRFNDENESTDFVIDVMQQTKYPQGL